MDIGGIALVLAAAERPQQFAFHDLGEPDDRVQRRAQLMAHVGQEFGLGAVGQLGALLGADQGLFALAQGSDVLRRAAVAEKAAARSEEHTSELQSLMRISYAVFCLKKKKQP